LPGPDVSANGLVTLSKQSDPAVRTEPFLAAHHVWICIPSSGSEFSKAWMALLEAFGTVDSVTCALGSGHLFAPRRPTLMGPKWAKPQAPVGSACGGFLRPDADPAVAATGHPWPGAAQSASMPIAPRISARTQPAPCVAFGGVAAIVGEKRCLFWVCCGLDLFDPCCELSVTFWPLRQQADSTGALRQTWIST